MTSLIANKIKINMCFASIKLFIVHITYVFKLLFVRYYYLFTTHLQATLLLYYAHNWDVQTRTQDYLNYPDYWPLCLILLYTHVFSLQNIAKIEGL